MKAHAALAALSLLGTLVAGPTAAVGKGHMNVPLPRGVTLPGDARASTAPADPGTWIVGARPGSVAATRIARAHGARHIAGAAWEVQRGRARALAAAMHAQGVLAYAEANRLARAAQAPVGDPLSARARWRDFVVGAQAPPAVTPTSPLIAMVDTALDTTHPEFGGSNITTLDSWPVTDHNGTANAAVAAAPANGVGILGIWPGGRVLNVPLQDGQRITCAESAARIAQALRAGAAVINMGYGSPAECATETEQLLRAVRADVVPVAAGGIEREQGSPPQYPAASAHVLTVGAIGPDNAPTTFSSESPALDLSAPGAGVLTAVPLSADRNLDPDGNGDGYASVGGTAVSSAMVSAAVAWIRAARPTLTGAQAAQVVRLGARDVGPEGRDSATGFGVLSLDGAVSEPAPAVDPFEPNDDIPLVDGQFFGAAAAPLSRENRPSVKGTVDRSEDPVDIHRIKIAAGARVRVSLMPSRGDPDLYLLAGKATGVRDARRQLGRSRRGGARADAVTVRNRRRRATTIYAVVRFSSAKRPRLADAGYTLTVSRP